MQDFEYQDDREQAQYDERIREVYLTEEVDSVLTQRIRKWKMRDQERNTIAHAKAQKEWR
uniref:Uncharacterized protein n=1 Tax=viral metagenome TaxID=1070528 RepID=A0A6M3JN39_9ZZZZ